MLKKMMLLLTAAIMMTPQGVFAGSDYAAIRAAAQRAKRSRVATPQVVASDSADMGETAGSWRETAADWGNAGKKKAGSAWNWLRNSRFGKGVGKAKDLAVANKKKTAAGTALLIALLTSLLAARRNMGYDKDMTPTTGWGSGPARFNTRLWKSVTPSSTNDTNLIAGSSSWRGADAARYAAAVPGRLRGRFQDHGWRGLDPRV